MKIVLDAMGSDHCPVPDVEGAVLAARETGDTILLVGNKAAIDVELAKYNTVGLSLEVIHTEQAVTMHDKPSQVWRAKKDSSMAVGLGLVRDGKADAFVSAGNTGAILAMATLYTLKRVRGVKRPALTTLIPLGEKIIVLTDLGANADCRPEWLVQFAIMGSLYSEHILGTKNPKVAVLSNGEEEGKGNTLVRETAALLEGMRGTVNFVGNAEPKEVLAGTADVIVSDGFVGNIAVKSMEALGDLLFNLIRTEVKSNVLNMVGAALMRPALRRVYHLVDLPSTIGGAPLLGVNGVVIIGHGRSNARGIKNAILWAHRSVEGKLTEVIREGMAHYSDTDSDTDSDDAVSTAQ